MKIKQWLIRLYRRTMYELKTFFGWFRRAFFGAKAKDVSGELSDVESPSKLVRKAFFGRKTAGIALGVLIGLFAFVFIAPLFVSLDVNYTDPLQQNVAPGYGLRALPKDLQNQVADVNGFADFTVGVGKDGRLFVWGNTKDRLRKIDVKEIPDAVQREGVRLASAGKDHVLALTNTGRLVGWGDDSCGQFGAKPTLNAQPMPVDLLSPIDVDAVQQLSSGYQASAILFKDGSGYAWGNINAVKNLPTLSYFEDTRAVAFTNSALVLLKNDGTIQTGGEDVFFGAVSSINGRQNSLDAYTVGRNVVKMATNNKCVALLTNKGELIVSGAFENGEDDLPTPLQGEYFTEIAGGTRHFLALTNLGNVYAWGHSGYGQTDVFDATAKDGKIFTGSLQSYVVDTDGALVKSAGLKGYLMGTDGRGRDVFARIVHGGKMTMTIGAVAVLVSSIIAIVVGCVSGYFGGWVDTLLMRITEIFASIPFLPFAMLLSQIIKNYNVSETARIFIIMLILGALSWTGLARIIRGQVLSEREKDFVLSARAMGVKEGTIAFRHVLPNVVSVILVSMTLDFAGCLLTESSLSYLGFGVQQPRPTWGNMLSGANNSAVIQNYWWQWLFPSLFLSIAVICINVIGDALRDALDPKRQER